MRPSDRSQELHADCGIDSAKPLLSIEKWDTGSDIQGLEFYSDKLLFSKGGYGSSVLEVWSHPIPRLLDRVDLPSDTFAEGIAVSDSGKLYQATWREYQLYIASIDEPAKRDSVELPLDMWGLATRGDTLYLSDGTAAIRRFQLPGFHQMQAVRVRSGREQVDLLNHLDFHGDQLVATRVGHWELLFIDPGSGAVNCSIDLHLLRRLLPQSAGAPTGVASLKPGTLVITGKNWNRIAKLRL